MGISYSTVDDGEGTDVYGTLRPKEARCFHCNKKLPRQVAPVIVWDGHVGDALVGIVFHPECALSFILRLTRDVHEVECKSHAVVARPRTPAK